MNPTMKKLGLALGAAAALCAPTPSHASDHVDGLTTAIDYAADTTDLYAFTSPKNPDSLVLVMNVHGFAGKGSTFSNAVDYKLRIRPIVDTQSLAPSTDQSREQSVVCTFTGGGLFDSNQRASCVFNLVDGTETLTFHTRTAGYKSGGSAQQGELRAFAGVRSDTWFLDLGRTLKFNAGSQVDQTPGKNGLAGTNILSIVVEVPKSRLSGSMLAVVGQTVRK